MKMRITLLWCCFFRIAVSVVCIYRYEEVRETKTVCGWGGRRQGMGNDRRLDGRLFVCAWMEGRGGALMWWSGSYFYDKKAESAAAASAAVLLLLLGLERLRNAGCCPYAFRPSIAEIADRFFYWEINILLFPHRRTPQLKCCSNIFLMAVKNAVQCYYIESVAYHRFYMALWDRKWRTLRYHL